MKTDDLVKQLEMYSNAIVAFIVGQSLAFSFTFGTSADFGCVVITEKPLAVGLAAHFVISTVLAVAAIAFLSRSIARLSNENQGLVRILFRGKCTVVVLFAIIPIVVLLQFAILRDGPSGRCTPRTAGTHFTQPQPPGGVIGILL